MSVRTNGVAAVYNWEDVDGWLFKQEADELRNLALSTGFGQGRHGGCIVEIGNYRGRSTVLLGQAAKATGADFYSIDPHCSSAGDSFGFGPEDRRALMANLVRAEVADVVRLLDVPSSVAALMFSKLPPIALLFVDGAHSYEECALDIGNFLPHMMPEGIIAVHDNNWPSVAQAMWSFITWRQIYQVKSIDITSFFGVNHAALGKSVADDAIALFNRYASQVGSPNQNINVINEPDDGDDTLPIKGLALGSEDTQES